MGQESKVNSCLKEELEKCKINRLKIPSIKPGDT